MSRCLWAGESGRVEQKMVLSLPLLSCESSVSVKKTLIEKKNLKNESKSAVDRFRNNNMIVKPDKLQLMLLQKSSKKNSKSITMKLNLRIRWLFHVLLLTIGYHLMTIYQIYVTKHIQHITKRYIQTEEIHEPKRIGSCS